MAEVTKTCSGNHVHSRKPKMKEDLTIKVTRSSTNNKSVTIEITGTLKLAASSETYGRPFSHYGITFSTAKVIETDTSSYEKTHGPSKYDTTAKKTIYGYYKLSTSDKNNVSVSWTQNWTEGTLKVYSHCGFSKKGDTRPQCSAPNDCSNIEIASIALKELPYEEKTDPTNFTDGSVYNHESVKNGKEKPDGNIKVTWSGEKKGSYNFIQYNIDLFKVTGHYDEGNYRIGSISNVSKNTWYNLKNDLRYNSDYTASEPRHIRPGDTLRVCLRAKYDKGSDGTWLPRYYIGYIKLYKNGAVFYKDSDGNTHECVKGYYKDDNNNSKTLRYAYYKTGDGATKVADVYTYCYE